MNDDSKSRTWVRNVAVGITVTVVGGIVLALLLRERPTVRNFAADPTEVLAGEYVNIAWDVVDADEVTIDQNIGRVPLSGSTEVVLLAPTTFTLTATNDAGTSAFSIEVRVDQSPNFDRSVLRLKDTFQGDSGWNREPINPQYASVYRTNLGSGRFAMMLEENRSATASYRDVDISTDEDFLIEVTANAVKPTDYSYGLVWQVEDGAEYLLYVSPAQNGRGTYSLKRSESWVEKLEQGRLGYGQSTNVLSPDDKNRRFESPYIVGGTARNKLTVVRRGDKVKIYVNEKFVNQGPYDGAPVKKVGLFIDGDTAAEFRHLTVRARGS